ncbi:DNA polymerase III subunit epsilon [Pseudidiomarina andamanensis]|uniref:DNA polymerase III subunit epsilon n=1 Tax=Pseudidiomarina andamanensis TaxID=1940690 RepID=A0AA92ESK3_9GAMM|nr:DNA polymerase III subunit epsilon [Pseudidiomarina andamanensis]MDS0218676.1 DNA polymerase III subunit epsilon [Pseudidiomarina andamanensis]QGT95540.1 DNA polymerase III subunit epsilon [Pseudidiomarina andamanensis]
MRQIILDTETTGLDPAQGHRIIEIGAVEVIRRKLTGRTFHVYINPQRVVEQEAIEVHGITNEFLEDKPVFAQIADEFLAFIEGAELVIHNAAFDVGFIDHEFRLLRNGFGKTTDYCTVLDTLMLAREKRPGQKNNLDALCRAYGIDNSNRTFHGALLDAELLADVYLFMTGGQTKLELAAKNINSQGAQTSGWTRIENKPPLKVVNATAEEEQQHQARLQLIQNHIWS